MKLHELESTRVGTAEDTMNPICDPCRMLGPHTDPGFTVGYPMMIPGARELARETIHHRGGSVHVMLVQDEETGLVSRCSVIDGHLGAVEV